MSSAWRGCAAAAAIVLACGVWCVIPLRAQGSPAAPGADQIESDPIKCWWKADHNAIYVGEQFTIVLTCGVIETSRVIVVADPTRLDPAAVNLTPFEVLGGTRHKDVEAPPWRYFEYSYVVRLLDDGFFGKDVDIPALQLTYTVQSGNDPGSRGRDQAYILPALPIKVLSLVPLTATDIWDGSSETFANREARLLRATEEFTAAGILFGFGLVLAGFALVRIVSRSRANTPAVERSLPLATVLRGCVQGTSQLKSDVARAGWTPESIARALAMLRIAGAAATGRPITQAQADRRQDEREGQLLVRNGMIRPKRSLISAPTTTAALDEQLAPGNGAGPDPAAQTIVEEIRDSLRVLNAARYGRNGHINATALDDALEQAARAIQRLHVKTQWPARATEALRHAADRVRDSVWSR